MSQPAPSSYAWSLTFAQAQLARGEAFAQPQEGAARRVVWKSDGYSPPSTDMARPLEAIAHLGWVAPRRSRGLGWFLPKPRPVPLLVPWPEICRGGLALSSEADKHLPLGCLLALRTLENGIPAVVLRYDQKPCADGLAAHVHIRFRSRIRGLNLGTEPMQLPKPHRLVQLDVAQLLNTPEDLAELMATASSGSPVEQAHLRATYYVVALFVWPTVMLAMARKDWERLLAVLDFGFSLQGLASLALLSPGTPGARICLEFLGTSLQGDVGVPQSCWIGLSHQAATHAEVRLSGVHDLLAYLREGFEQGFLSLGEGLTAHGLLSTAWLTLVGMSAPPAKGGLVATQQWLATRLLVQAQLLRAGADPLRRPWLVSLGGLSGLRNVSALRAYEELVSVLGPSFAGLWHDVHEHDFAADAPQRASAELALAKAAGYAVVAEGDCWPSAAGQLLCAPQPDRARLASRLAWIELARGFPGLPAGFDGWLTLDAPHRPEDS